MDAGEHPAELPSSGPSQTLNFMDNNYPLSPDQKAAFARDGYLLIENFFDDEEHGLLSKLCDEVAAWPAVPGKSMRYHENHVQTGERMLCRIENFTPYSPELCYFSKCNRALSLLEALHSEPYILFKEKINYKLSGGGGFPPHQDAPAYIQFGQVSHVTIMPTVDATTLENGCLFVVPKSHAAGILPQESNATISPSWCAEQQWVPVECKAGSILVFGAFLAHKSGPNETDKARRNVYLTYNSVVEGDKRQTYYDEKRKLFPPAIERIPGQDYSKGALVYNLGTPIVD